MQKITLTLTKQELDNLHQIICYAADSDSVSKDDLMAINSNIYFFLDAFRPAVLGKVASIDTTFAPACLEH